MPVCALVNRLAPSSASISTSQPVSSRVSRRAASTSVSLGSRWPAGWFSTRAAVVDLLDQQVAAVAEHHRGHGDVRHPLRVLVAHRRVPSKGAHYSRRRGRRGAGRCVVFFACAGRLTGSRRHAPVASPSRLHGPMRQRTRRRVGKPTAALMRRTWRLRPSVSVRLSQEVGMLARKRTGGSRSHSGGAAMRSAPAGRVGPSFSVHARGAAARAPHR